MAQANSGPDGCAIDRRSGRGRRGGARPSAGVAAARSVLCRLMASPATAYAVADAGAGGQEMFPPPKAHILTGQTLYRPERRNYSDGCAAAHALTVDGGAQAHRLERLRQDPKRRGLRVDPVGPWEGGSGCLYRLCTQFGLFWFASQAIRREISIVYAIARFLFMVLEGIRECSNRVSRLH